MTLRPHPRNPAVLKRADHRRLWREAEDTAPILRDPIPCNTCGGTGYLPLSDAEIVARMVEEARRHYWPTKEHLNA